MKRTAPSARPRSLAPFLWLPVLVFAATFLAPPALARGRYVPHGANRSRQSETEAKFTILGDHGDAKLRATLADAMRAEKTAIRGYLVRVREPDGNELAAIYLVSFRDEEEQLDRLGRLYSQTTGDAAVWLAADPPDSINRQIHACTPFYKVVVKPVAVDPRRQTRYFVGGMITLAVLLFVFWKLLRKVLPI